MILMLKCSVQMRTLAYYVELIVWNGELSNLLCVSHMF